MRFRAAVVVALLVASSLVAGAPEAEAGHCDRTLPTLGCKHWKRKNGYSTATAYVLDSTSIAWPVYASTIKWDEAATFNPVYRWYTDGCPPPPNTNVVGEVEIPGGGPDPDNLVNNCIEIRQINDPTKPNGAAFTSTTCTGTHCHIEWAIITFNDGWGSMTSDQARDITCEEFGHAFGLDDAVSPWLDSCMRDATLYGPPYLKYPNGHDYHTLWADMYNH